MPSSKAALTAKIAELQAENVAQAAQILTLEMQVGAMENILSFQNGAFEEIAQTIEKGPHAFQEQEICAVLQRHLGRKVQWLAPASPFQ